MELKTWNQVCTFSWTLDEPRGEKFRLFSCIAPPRSPKYVVFSYIFLIFNVFSWHNYPPNWAKNLKLGMQVEYVKILDVVFVGFDFLVVLNPSSILNANQVTIVGHENQTELFCNQKGNQEPVFVIERFSNYLHSKHLGAVYGR